MRWTKFGVSLPEFNVSTKCEHAHCGTSVCVSYGRGETHVEITRRFGTLKDATDHSWCVQLERDVQKGVQDGIQKGLGRRMFDRCKKDAR